MTLEATQADSADSLAGEMLDYPALDPARTAVVIGHQIHPQQGCLPQLARLGVDTGYYQQRVQQQVIPNTQRLAATARAVGAQVVFLRLGAASPHMGEVTRPFRPVLQGVGRVGRKRGLRCDSRVGPAAR